MYMKLNILVFQTPDPTAEIKLLSDQKNELEKKVVTLQKQLDNQIKVLTKPFVHSILPYMI